MSEAPDAPSPYEGLELVELLDLMHPLVAPEPISMLPQTAGWWVVAAWLVMMMGLLVWQILRHRRRNRYRREALAELRLIAAQADDPTAAVRLARVLKRTALAAYPRAEVAALHGEAWAAYLVRTCPGDANLAVNAPRLAALAYAGDDDVASLIEPAQGWIRRHRV